MTDDFAEQVSVMAYGHVATANSLWSFERLDQHLREFHGVPVTGDRADLIYHHKRAHRRESGRGMKK